MFDAVSSGYKSQQGFYVVLQKTLVFFCCPTAQRIECIFEKVTRARRSK